MDMKQMKLDIFTIKALEAKGYVVEEVIKLSEKEIDNLPIATKLCEAIKAYVKNGAKSESQLTDTFNSERLKESIPEQHAAVLSSKYIENTVEQNTVLEKIEDEVKEKMSEASAELEDTEHKVLDVIRTSVSTDDIKMIKDSLAKKELKTFQTYIKHLKSEIPADILNGIDSTVIAELIENRIAEVKTTK